MLVVVVVVLCKLSVTITVATTFAISASTIPMCVGHVVVVDAVTIGTATATTVVATTAVATNPIATVVAVRLQLCLRVGLRTLGRHL